MITFNDLYEAERKERYSDQLQSLPKNFLADVADYFREKKELISKDNDAFSDMIMKTKKQLETAVTLFKGLMLRRRKKILNLILIAAETGISKQDFDNMLSFEKELFDDLMKNINVSDKKLAESLNGEKNKPKKFEMVVFKKNVEEFVGMDGQTIGGFEKGQISNLPVEIVKILVDDRKAEVI